MRNLKMMLKAFVGVAAVSGLIGCEEVDQPARTVAPAVTQPIAQTTIPVENKPIEAKPTELKPIEPKTIEPVKQAKIDEPADSDEESGGDLVGKARQALDGGQLARAEKLAERATKKMPNRSSAWNVLGRVQLKRGERKQAIASFEQAVELNPKSSWAQNNLGLAYLYEGRYDDAVDALEEATSLEPVESYMFNNLGMAYEHLDRLEEAREAYRQAVELSNDRAKENLARLEGVKSVFRSAKLDEKKLGETKVDDQVGVGVDGGAR